MASQSVTISIARGDTYQTVEKVEVKIDIPDSETCAIIYTQLRNDIRRLEDGIREHTTSLLLKEVNS